jgi:hypothetical protein
VQLEAALIGGDDLDGVDAVDPRRLGVCPPPGSRTDQVGHDAASKATSLRAPVARTV